MKQNHGYFLVITKIVIIITAKEHTCNAKDASDKTPTNQSLPINYIGRNTSESCSIEYTHFNIKPCTLCVKFVNDANVSNCYADGIYHHFFLAHDDGTSRMVYSPISVIPMDDWCYIDVTYQQETRLEDRLFLNDNQTMSCFGKWQVRMDNQQKPTQYKITMKNSTGNFI